MKARRFLYLALAAVMMASPACGPVEVQPTPENGQNEQPNQPQPPQETAKKPSEEIRQADVFAQDLLGTYYLWNSEIANDLKRFNPDTCFNPISVVNKIRYHQNNKEVDKWTSMTSSLESMTSSVQGLGLSFGYELMYGPIANKEGCYYLIVCYVNKDKPAHKAGLKRGDLIMSIDGKDITFSNMNDAFNAEKVTLGIAHLTSDGYLGPIEKNVTLTADKDWEDPVLVAKTFDLKGKKVGYLAYSSFDLKSSNTLPDVFRQFKADGIKELILDLRYNGGGYTFTECLLASLIAPPANVVAKDVFQTEVYNSILANAWKEQGYDTNTYFSTKHEMASQNISQDIADANPGITKLYAIVTKGSASASEGLIVGLGPYMDITLVGKQTYGKYCAGLMMSPEDLYGKNSGVDYSKITKWGIYVMVSKFADKNGHNAAQPDGIPVDIQEKDSPLDGYQLGDENETMLKAALTAAGKLYPKSTAPATRASSGMETILLDHGMPRGMLVKTDLPSVFVND